VRKILLTGVVAGILAALFIGNVKAEDHGGHTHAGAVGKFYQNWMRPDNRNISCCHDKDCAPAQSKMINGKWQARNSDSEPWVEVPESRVERERDSPDGRSHLCKAGTIGSVLVYCFLPANGS
jgi:hypothetical protein